MSSLSRTLRQADLERHLSHLQRELQGLRKAAGQASGNLLDDASDFGEAVMHGGQAVARTVRRSALDAGKAVRRDPVPAIAVTVAALCLASLVLSKK